jgi:hypothetical protein
MRLSPVMHPVGLLITLTALAAALALAPAPAMAQQAQTREGFFFRAGLGYGSMGLGCDRCNDLDRQGGLSGYLTLGGAMSSNVLLGVELDGWYTAADGAHREFSTLSAAVWLYPMAARGLFLKGGVGASTIFGDYNALDQDIAAEVGLGLVVGAGYDVRIGGNTSLTPHLSYFRGSFDGGDANVFQAGLGIAFH